MTIEVKYIIKKNGKRYNRLYFQSYESARSYIRKKLRPIVPKEIEYPNCDFGLLYSNPSHSRYGFRIEKVA